MSGSAFAVTHHAFSRGAGRTSDGNGNHASTLKSPSYTKSVSWQHYPLDEWKPKRFSLPITNTTLVKYGKLGYIVPRPQKIRGRWLIDRRAVFVGPGETGIAPEIHTGDDDALKEILTHVTEATKKQH